MLTGTQTNGWEEGRELSDIVEVEEGRSGFLRYFMTSSIKFKGQESAFEKLLDHRLTCLKIKCVMAFLVVLASLVSSLFF